MSADLIAGLWGGFVLGIIFTLILTLLRVR
jgi:hypothetical protein